MFRSCFDASRAHRDVDSRYDHYILTVTKASVVSECRMRAAHVCRLRSRSSATRKDRSPFEVWSERGSSLPFSDILESYADARRTAGSADRRVIKFNFELQGNAESQLSRETLAGLRSQTYPEVAGFFCSALHRVTAPCYSLLLPIFPSFLKFLPGQVSARARAIRYVFQVGLAINASLS